MIDKLVKIPFKDLPFLRDIYKVEWPKYNVGYGIVDTYYRWLKQDPDIPQLEIYSLNGDWSDGTFVVIDLHMIYCNTFSEDFTRLEKALSLVDINEKCVIASVESRLHDFMTKYTSDNQLSHFASATKWYRMPQEEATKIDVELPEGITLKPLSEKHTELVNNLWPHRHPGSINYLTRLTRYNINIGAFKSNGELIAWCFRLPAGGLATLQVIDSEKRKGYGSLIVKTMAKLISDTGYDVFAPIVVENQPSMKMFEKNGFKAFDKMYWFVPQTHG